jgi:hypothetical protein
MTIHLSLMDRILLTVRKVKRESCALLLAVVALHVVLYWPMQETDCKM